MPQNFRTEQSYSEIVSDINNQVIHKILTSHQPFVVHYHYRLLEFASNITALCNPTFFHCHVMLQSYLIFFLSYICIKDYTSQSDTGIPNNSCTLRTLSVGEIIPYYRHKRVSYKYLSKGVHLLLLCRETFFQLEFFLNYLLG